MIPYSYNLVDMGGIDLALVYRTVVPGVYEKIVEAMNLCGDVILYNWKFAGINIVPSAYSILQQEGSILINGLIQVTELDEITIPGIVPPPSVIPLEVIENGIYEVTEPVSGFNPVTVNVATGVQVPVCELFRHIMFSNSASDKLQRNDRWFQRNTNEPVLFLTSAHLQNDSIAYSGYAAISFSESGVTGTSSAYGDLVALTQRMTPNGTIYYVQVMNGMYPPSIDSGRVRFMYSGPNYEFMSIPNLSTILVNGATRDFVGNQNLISLMQDLIDSMYQEYYS